MKKEKLDCLAHTSLEYKLTQERRSGSGCSNLVAQTTETTLMGGGEMGLLGTQCVLHTQTHTQHQKRQTIKINIRRKRAGSRLDKR